MFFSSFNLDRTSFIFIYDYRVKILTRRELACILKMTLTILLARLSFEILTTLIMTNYFLITTGEKSGSSRSNKNKFYFLRKFESRAFLHLTRAFYHDIRG